MKKSNKNIIRILCVLVLIYIFCTPFRRQNDKTMENNHGRMKIYIDADVVHPQPDNSLACVENGENVFLFIMIPSAITNFEQRNVIRRTWGDVSKVRPNVVVRFIVGRSEQPFLQELVLKENRIHHDLVIKDIPEFYENLTQKSVAMLSWIVSYCSRARYFLKIDDDMFLNLPRLLNFLSNHAQTNSIVGCKYEHSKPRRYPFSKWRVSWEQYSKSEYPVYVSGPAYVISGDIISKLYQATKEVPQFVFEDVYITGMCRKHIGALAKSHPEFTCGYRDVAPCGSHFRNQITGHHYSPTEIGRMWTELQDRGSTCRLIDSFGIYIIVDLLKWIFL
ncbi:beta-1,3-galactosyltransferase 1-like [Magallana gigas]|uniref:beta-1,3-galactosyltransferase 1-like n=1 Tax=Magallana gigas TaxID=29159 RepID=UPI00333FED6C